MAERSAIEWTDATFNPWIGCTKISPACDHCYAEALMDTRHSRVKWGGERSRTSDSNWQQPCRWQRQAAAFMAENGRRRRVFCASLADVFDNQVPPEWRADLWALIRDTPDLDWQLLTKRPQNIGKMLPAYWDDVKGHVWLGTTVEDQTRADQNIPHLLQHDAAVRFVSCEPLLGPIDLTNLEINGDAWMDALRPLSAADLWRSDWSPEVTGTTLEEAIEGFEDWGLSYPPSETKAHGIDWVIAGGESGHHARPSHPDWFRTLRDQCADAGVPFLFKQWGGWAPLAKSLPVEAGAPTIAAWSDGSVQSGRDVSAGQGAALFRGDRKITGRLLDVVEHNGFPEGSADG